LDNNVLGLLSNVEWFATQWNVFSIGSSRTAQNTLHLTLHCSICGKRFLSINSVASHNPHSMKASGHSQRTAESSDSTTVWYMVVLQYYWVSSPLLTAPASFRSALR
ncbi:hypothetical protein T07_185, partial [Trichinella nelsoni]